MTPKQTKEALRKAMDSFTTQMIALIRDCSRSKNYRDLTGGDALKLVADKLDANLAGEMRKEQC